MISFVLLFFVATIAWAFYDYYKASTESTDAVLQLCFFTILLVVYGYITCLLLQQMNFLDGMEVEKREIKL